MNLKNIYMGWVGKVMQEIGKTPAGKKVGDFFFRSKKKVPDKKEKEKQVDINSKEPESKINPDKDVTEGKLEAGKKWTDEIDIEREGAANSGAGRARGRSLGDLDKIENAPTSKPVTDVNIGNKVKDIEGERNIEDEAKEIGQEASESYSGKIGEKKIEQILEEGKPEEGKTWGERIRSDKNLEFESLEKPDIEARAVELLKEDSSKFFVPENSPMEQPPLNDNQKSKIIKLMGDDKEAAPEGIFKSHSKININDLITKDAADIELKEEGNFFEELYHDQEVNDLELEQSDDIEAGGEGEMEFDFD